MTEILDERFPTAVGCEIDLDRCVDYTPITIRRRDWVHHPQIGEKIKNELVLVQMRCPKCKEYITVTDADVDLRGNVIRKNKKHTCGFKKMYFILEKYTRHPYL